MNNKKKYWLIGGILMLLTSVAVCLAIYFIFYFYNSSFAGSYRDPAAIPIMIFLIPGTILEPINQILAFILGENFFILVYLLAFIESALVYLLIGAFLGHLYWKRKYVEKVGRLV